MANRASIFISYRRNDTADISGRIYDRLVAGYGSDAVFKDVISLQGGQRFPAQLENAITEQTVILVIIGQHWLAMTQARREDPYDFGRIELEIALRQHATIIPVLVQGASMPTSEELPASITDIANFHSIQVRSDPDFRHDMDDVLRAIGFYARVSRVRIQWPWIAVTSAVLLVALGAVVLWQAGIWARPGMTTRKSVATQTPLGSPLACKNSQGAYLDGFMPFGAPFPAPPMTQAIQGQVIGVIGSGDAESDVANTRYNFDPTNQTCTVIERTGSVIGSTQFLSPTSPYQILATDFSFTEVRPLQVEATTWQDTPLAVAPYVMVVNKSVFASIKNLSHQQLAAIFQNHPAITNWRQVDGPDIPIDAVWSGDTATLSSIWPTDQTSLNTLSGALVAFKRDVLRNGDASSTLNILAGNGQQTILEHVAEHPGAIAFVSQESYLYYTQQNQNPLIKTNVFPLMIDGFAPTSDTINAGSYTFWDIVHGYTKTTLDQTSAQGKAVQALIGDITRNANAVTALGWIPLGDVAQNMLTCHEQIDLCPL